MNCLISECCNAFTIQDNLNIICSNCNEVVGTIKNEDNIVISVCFNSKPELINTINSRGNFNKTAQRCAHDKTCMLVDNITCSKCGSKARFLRDDSGNPVYVCSNCRLLL